MIFEGALSHCVCLNKHRYRIWSQLRHRHYKLNSVLWRPSQLWRKNSHEGRSILVSPRNIELQVDIFSNSSSAFRHEPQNLITRAAVYIPSFFWKVLCCISFLLDFNQYCPVDLRHSLENNSAGDCDPLTWARWIEHWSGPVQSRLKLFASPSQPVDGWRQLTRLQTALSAGGGEVEAGRRVTKASWRWGKTWKRAQPADLFHGIHLPLPQPTLLLFQALKLSTPSRSTTRQG